MANIETRKGMRKISYRVEYQLWVNGKKKEKPERDPFDDLEEAKAFLSVAEVIESKSKRNLASPAEVALWVEQKYIKRKVAAKAFPLYRDSLLNKVNGT